MNSTTSTNPFEQKVFDDTVYTTKNYPAKLTNSQNAVLYKMELKRFQNWKYEQHDLYKIYQHPESKTQYVVYKEEYGDISISYYMLPTADEKKALTYILDRSYDTLPDVNEELKCVLTYLLKKNALFDFREFYLHRTDGPAVIRRLSRSGITSYKFYENGKLHREDGPAVYDNDTTLLYFLGCLLCL